MVLTRFRFSLAKLMPNREILDKFYQHYPSNRLYLYSIDHTNLIETDLDRLLADIPAQYALVGTPNGIPSHCPY